MPIIIIIYQTWANYGSRAKSGTPVLLFWPTGTYTNISSHRELSGRHFFPLDIMDGSDFQKNKPQQCKIGIKNEVKTFYFGDHIRMWTVISKKKKKRSSYFPISAGPAVSTRDVPIPKFLPMLNPMPIPKKLPILADADSDAD